MQQKTCLLLVTALTLLLVGCGSEEAKPMTSATSTYLDMAQDFIEKGDYESAINVLQKGYDSTGDEALKKAMQEAIAAQIGVTGVSESSTGDFDYHDYLGLWANPDIGGEGGYVLYYSEDISGASSIQITRYYDSFSGLSALMWHEIEDDDFDGNKASFSYEDDWGNAGSIVLQFGNGEIICNIVCEDESGADIGLVDGTLKNYELVSMPNVYDIIDSSAYLGELGLVDDDYGDYSNEPVYDPSKASGILASLGMTEQEFRDSCIVVGFKKNESFNDMRKFPAQYIGGHYTAYSPYDSGAVLSFNVEINDKAVTDENFVYYFNSKNAILLRDMRDDTRAPTISIGDKIRPYMIFEDVVTENGVDLLFFSLISVEIQ